MKYLRLLLWPVSLLYGAVVVIRNWCYDAGWFTSASFNLPLITIGNLTIGGAGKSPMTEYLIALLKPKYKVATLSRGYGRETKGFILADENSTVAHIGDEPSQFKNKFPNVTVAVCEDRVAGVSRLQNTNDVILLDDAYQHQAIKAGMNILLFDFNKLNDFRLMLPAGNLREPMSGKIRADILIVSKCPLNLALTQRSDIEVKLRPYPYQHLFFTGITYKELLPFNGAITKENISTGSTVFLLTGIAGAAPLKQHLLAKGCKIIHYKYPDHHTFSLKNILKLVDDFNASASFNKIIITTEKDAERLKSAEIINALVHLPVLIQPIGIEFLSDNDAFDKLIENYVRKYTKHSSIH